MSKVVMTLADPLAPMHEIESCHGRILSLIDSVGDLLERIANLGSRDDMIANATVRQMLYRDADRGLTLLSIAQDYLGQAEKQAELEYQHLVATRPAKRAAA